MSPASRTRPSALSSIMTSELLLSLSEAGSDGASTEKTAFSSGTESPARSQTTS